MQGCLDEFIARIGRLAECPKVIGPIGGDEIWQDDLTWNDADDQATRTFSDKRASIRALNAFIGTPAWDVMLGKHQRLFFLFALGDVPIPVYQAFHEYLRLDDLETDECLNAWLGAAHGNRDLASSYEASPDHVVLNERCSRIDHARFGKTVFKKTPFIARRLGELAELRVKEAEQLAAKAEQETLKRLRMSRFQTFIYVMEDLRNGSFKIGRSKTPGKRERTLQSEVPEIVLRLSIPAGDSQETLLHEHFAAKRIRGEWFSLTVEDLVWLVDHLKANGDVDRADMDHAWLGAVFFKSKR